MTALTIECAKEELWLCPGKAVFWPREKMLWVADTHFGKSASFRAAGFPVPRGVTRTDLDRLDALVKSCSAKQLLILGDFIHAASGRAEATLQAMKEWFAAHPSLTVTLIRGNHDRHAGDPPAEWGMEVVDQPYRREPFVFFHEPPDRHTDDTYAVAGHLHPTIRLRDPEGTSVRCSCFWFGPRRAVLPSFGSFTGGYPITPIAGDRVYPIAQEQVWLAPTISSALKPARPG